MKTKKYSLFLLWKQGTLNGTLLNHFYLLMFSKLAFGTLVLINIITNISWTPFDTASVMKSIKNIIYVQVEKPVRLEVSPFEFSTIQHVHQSVDEGYKYVGEGGGTNT